MLASIVLAVVAIRRRDFTSHGAWMTRGYAIALGAGTQVFTMLPWVVVFGPIGAADELPRTVLMTAGWVINLAVAEYIIRWRGPRPKRTSASDDEIGSRSSASAPRIASLSGWPETTAHPHLCSRFAMMMATCICSGRVDKSRRPCPNQLLVFCNGLAR